MSRFFGCGFSPDIMGLLYKLNVSIMELSTDATLCKQNISIMQPLRPVSVGVTKVCVKKINLNWKMPPPLANAFDAVVMAKWGNKGKWKGACAAALMYMSASDDERSTYEAIAESLGQKKLPSPARKIIDSALRASAGDDEENRKDADEDERGAVRDTQAAQHKPQGGRKRIG